MIIAENHSMARTSQSFVQRNERNSTIHGSASLIGHGSIHIWPISKETSFFYIFKKIDNLFFVDHAKLN